jgi:hypothetical protein
MDEKKKPKILIIASDGDIGCANDIKNKLNSAKFDCEIISEPKSSKIVKADIVIFDEAQSIMQYQYIDNSKSKRNQRREAERKEKKP